ncbi:hypothetical protein C8Q78DRAFT_1193196 [Trametes maxima]|nr:hypothetical protein C8Q78DRAFT_1193196 [Trametes maxima]
MRLPGLSPLIRSHPQRTSLFLSRQCLSALHRSRLPALAPSLRTASSATIQKRLLATGPPSSAHEPSKPDAPAQPEAAQIDEEYRGPLAATFRRLKIFSLSSLTLTFALTPFIFVLETTSSVPLSGRAALAGIAMATSSVSTALVAWCGRPYVNTLRFLEPDGAQAAGSGRAVEMTTLTLGLHKRVTTVYDTAFLVPTSRFFATWELAEAFKLSQPEVESARAEGLIPREETVAETKTADGKVVGRWIVSWDENGVGACREVGQVVRHFNVHPELLSRPIH